MSLYHFPSPTIGEMCERVGAESATIHYNSKSGYLVAFFMPDATHYALDADLNKAVAEASRKCNMTPKQS